MFFVKKNACSKKIIVPLFLVLLICFILELTCFAAEEKVAKIGLLTTVTGRLAEDGVESIRGAKMAIKEINSAGGINGYKLELLVGDTKDRVPAAVLSAVEYLIAKGVDCFIGSSTSRNNFEIDIIAEKNIPYILSTEPNETRDIIEPNPEKYPTIWSIAPLLVGYETEPPRIIEKWITEGKFDPRDRKFAVISNDTPYAVNISTGMKKALIEKYGWTCVLDEMVPLTDILDWRPTLAKLRISKPSFIINTDFVVGNAAIFMKQFYEEPFNALVFIQYAPVLQEFINLTKEYSTGVLYSLIGGTINSPKATMSVDILNRYEKEYGEKASGVYAAYVNEQIVVYADALKKVGDPKKYLEIGKAIGEIDREIVMGRLVFDQKTHLALQGDEYYPFQLYQLWEGERNLLHPENFATSDFKLPPWFK